MRILDSCPLSIRSRESFKKYEDFVPCQARDDKITEGPRILRAPHLLETRLIRRKVFAVMPCSGECSASSRIMLKTGVCALNKIHSLYQEKINEQWNDSACPRWYKCEIWVGHPTYIYNP